ncbi:uncharacterized protein LDX57_012946 [Aspergillus melleus]|uniref:uncharacterized protein n=2 Tax=Aspergillus melleus TaxID=138277 RepID=UPI001E8D9050|nr:uncharacterized protein LDX57_012946 [Aspergillus melleus]KAH8435315.1 hypothetical protein LDX57_012946 [Aspergillus melleus]
MRFLCLHGMGENGRVFEAQTAAIRHRLGPDHTYEWLDGSVPTDMAPGLETVAMPSDEFLMYVDDSQESRVRLLAHLQEFVAAEGPFDGLFAFSHGASCGATLLLHELQKNPQAAPFRCAIFFCGGPPEDPKMLLEGDRRVVDAATDGEVLDLPTAHIWGRNDHRYAFGPQLSSLCSSANREVFVHDGGHEIPGPRDPEDVRQAVQVIKRTLARATADESV